MSPKGICFIFELFFFAAEIFQRKAGSEVAANGRTQGEGKKVPCR
jgi:hypothetical protein